MQTVQKKYSLAHDNHTQDLLGKAFVGLDQDFAGDMML